MPKKKRVGRPAKKKTVLRKSSPKKQSPVVRSEKSGPAAVLSAHGLARWQPQAGDQLITQSIGSMTYSGRSWKKSPAVAAVSEKRPKTGAKRGVVKKRGRPSKVVAAQAAEPVKRKPGRPRKAQPGVPMQQARKGQRGQRVVEDAVINDIDTLDEMISSVA